MSRNVPHQSEERSLFEDVSRRTDAIYLREICRHAPLTAAQEIALAQQIEQGKSAHGELDTADESRDSECRAELEQTVQDGETARSYLIECNLRLVVYVARRFLNRGLSLMDLIQEGSIGRQQAVDRYDWRRGFRLNTYAYWWIRLSMARSLAEQSRTIRLPLHVIELLTRVTRAERELLQSGAVPTAEAVADALGIDVERVAEVHRQARLPVSIDSHPVWGDVLSDDAAEGAAQRELESQEVSKLIGDALEQLDPRERTVLQMRFGLVRNEEYSVAEIARALGISPQQVRQIEQGALAKLRHLPPLRDSALAYLAA